MKLLEEIKKEHDLIRDYFLQMENNEDKAPEIYQDLAVFVLTHHEAEETVVFKELSRKKDVKEAKNELMAEHAAVRRTMQILLDTPPDDPMWMAHLHVLKDLLYHHVEEEENELFQILREEKDETELSALQKEFLDYFRQAEPKSKKQVAAGDISKPEDRIPKSRS